MTLLKTLARMGGQASLTALADQVQEAPAKVHRYLVSLVQEGLVAQDPRTQHYRLGPEAIQVGLAAMRQADPVRAAEASLIRLRDGLQVTSFLAVMGNLGPVIVRWEEPVLPVTVNVRVGSVMSLLWSATGRTFLAFSDNQAIQEQAGRELVEASEERRASLSEVAPIAQLRNEVRSLGCAAIRDVYLKGISAVAAPVHDFSGQVCAVITALGATGGFDPAPSGRIGAAVRAEARRVSADLGYTGEGPAA